MMQYLVHFSPYLQQDENFFSFVASLCGGGIGLAVGIVILIANWKIFTKAANRVGLCLFRSITHISC